MFQEFVNQAWTPSSGAVIVTDNTDYSIDGSSKKIVFDDGLNEYVTISFDTIDLSEYEEISFQIHRRPLTIPGSHFSITVDGTAFEFEKDELQTGWNHILIDCTGMGSITSIVITSLVSDLTLFVDYIGCRKVDHTRDVDLVEALQDTISLNYGVTTTLAEGALAGDSTISLTSKAYIFNTSVLTLDNGVGVTETVYLEDKNGTIKGELENNFSIGTPITVNCPTLIEDYMDIEPDPVCGIMIFDKGTKNDVYTEYFKNGSAKKVYTGALGVCIYIDCGSKLKLLQLSREFDFSYGESFRILLDGEVITMYLESSEYLDNVIGNNPRMSYYYKIEAQGYVVRRTVSTTVTLTMLSKNVTEVIE